MKLYSECESVEVISQGALDTPALPFASVRTARRIYRLRLGRRPLGFEESTVQYYRIGCSELGGLDFMVWRLWACWQRLHVIPVFTNDVEINKMYDI